MHFTAVTKAVAALILATTAVAVPAPVPAAEAPVTEAVEIAARADSVQLIQLWNDADFLDLKFTGSGVVDACYNLPAKFTDVSTSGKAKAGFRCTIWVDKACKGDGFSFNANPGKNQFPSWIDNKASSWKCVKA